MHGGRAADVSAADSPSGQFLGRKIIDIDDVEHRLGDGLELRRFGLR